MIRWRRQPRRHRKRVVDGTEQNRTGQQTKAARDRHQESLARSEARVFALRVKPDQEK